MKKFLIILCTILTACSLLLQKEEETFVNPIFYKPLEGLKYRPDLYKIRPDKLFRQNFYGYNTTVNCEMLENTINTVVLKCLHTPKPPEALEISGDKPSIWTYKFYIWPQEEQTSEIGTYIRVYKYLNDEYDKFKDKEDWLSYSNLIATFSAKDRMKVWGDAVNTFDETQGADDKHSD